MSTAKQNIEESVNYRNWFINYIRTIVPADFKTCERVRSWPAFLPLLRTVIKPQDVKDEALKDFDIEWLDCRIPRYLHTVAEPRWRTVQSEINRDTPFWEYMERRVLETISIVHNGWEGIIKVSRGEDSLYLCDTVFDTGDRPRELCFVAYKEKVLLEDLLMALHKMERAETEVRRREVIFCPNGPDIDLEVVELDRVVLPKDLKSDIVGSTETFFKRIDAFRGIGVPTKRGFLLVGDPGNGKTLLCYALAAHIIRQFNVRVATIRVDAGLETDDVSQLYRWASNNGPSIILLEDVDTILTETRVTRSGFLNVLDGFKPERGVLTIATTNYPEKLDPALAHRPSRFDRVWKIPVPAADERRAFIKKLFTTPALDDEHCEKLVKRTTGWSMAYVQEIKATAMVCAVQNDRDHIAPEDIDHAVELLQRQFRSGQKNHKPDTDGERMGFVAA